MAHALILGMTESGKTTLAKKLAAGYKLNEYGILVYDPLSDPSWEADYRTSDMNDFLDTFWASRSCAVFIDEAGDCAGQHDKIMHKTATRGRHWGHRCHYISQRGTMIARTIRDQCSHLFLFGTALEDCKVHAKEWNKPQLLEAANFVQGDFFHVTRFGKITKANIFNIINGSTKIDTTNQISDDSGGGDSGSKSNPAEPKTNTGKRPRK